MKEVLKVTTELLARRFMKLVPPDSVIYGVPRGGQMAIYHVLASGWVMPEEYHVTTDLHKATVIVDDIIDSGRTREKYAVLKEKYCPDASYVALFDKQQEGLVDWIQFPWEDDKKSDAIDHVTRILQHIGEDTSREGLRETPERIVRSWNTLFAGYKDSASRHFTSFKEGACDQMVVLRDIEFYSTCEHHMLPFNGRAHIAYLPRGKVIGISKLARILDVFARRLQIQERIGEQVVDTLMTHLNPLGAGCVLEAQHYCMTSRGVQKQNSVMVTSSLRGCFRDEQDCRSEFFRLVGK